MPSPPLSCGASYYLIISLFPQLPELLPAKLLRGNEEFVPLFAAFQLRLDGLQRQEGKNLKNQYYTLAPPSAYAQYSKGSALLCNHLLKLSTALYRTTTVKHDCTQTHVGTLNVKCGTSNDSSCLHFPYLLTSSRRISPPSSPHPPPFGKVRVAR